MLIVMVSCTIRDVYNKIMSIKLNSDQYRELITPVIDSLALTGIVAGELNQLRRN